MPSTESTPRTASPSVGPLRSAPFGRPHGLFGWPHALVQAAPAHHASAASWASECSGATSSGRPERRLSVFEEVCSGLARPHQLRRRRVSTAREIPQARGVCEDRRAGRAGKRCGGVAEGCRARCPVIEPVALSSSRPAIVVRRIRPASTVSLGQVFDVTASGPLVVERVATIEFSSGDRVGRVRRTSAVSRTIHRRDRVGALIVERVASIGSSSGDRGARVHRGSRVRRTPMVPWRRVRAPDRVEALRSVVRGPSELQSRCGALSA